LEERSDEEEEEDIVGGLGFFGADG
jgi:hypothetical protein